jgi:hypothetical protein
MSSSFLACDLDVQQDGTDIVVQILASCFCGARMIFYHFFICCDKLHLISFVFRWDMMYVWVLVAKNIHLVQSFVRKQQLSPTFRDRKGIQWRHSYGYWDEPLTMPWSRTWSNWSFEPFLLPTGFIAIGTVDVNGLFVLPFFHYFSSIPFFM